MTWALFLRTDANASALYEICYEISRYFLEKILGIFGLDLFTGVVLRWLTDIGNWILQQVGALLGQGTQQDMANALVNTFSSYSSYDIAFNPDKDVPV